MINAARCELRAGYGWVNGALRAGYWRVTGSLVAGRLPGGLRVLVMVFYTPYDHHARH